MHVDQTLQDELKRVHATSQYSEFERMVIGEIVAWAMNTKRNFASHGEMVDAFWHERLHEIVE